MLSSAPFSVALLFTSVATASAHRVPFTKVRRPGHSNLSSRNALSTRQDTDSGDNALSLTSVQDLIYMAEMTVGGNDYLVQLDTGSSDLWIKGDTTPIPGSRPTHITQNLTYALGWAYGNVSYAPVTFAGISVETQAFLDVTEVFNPALGYGAAGVVGLGFTSLSFIDLLVNRTSEDTGRALLYNLFDQNPDEQNFIAFALHRSMQEEDEIEGSFAIGEYEPEYAEIQNQPEVPTWPVVHPSRWNVLLDALIIGDRIIIPETEVEDAPSNKAVVLMDSGSSFTYAPAEICEAIYGDITNARFDQASGYWQVPCNEEVDMALQIGGGIYPLHPLDVVPSGLFPGLPDVCIGSFVPTNLAFGAGEFDWLIGDNFLRSVYSIYDFGDPDPSGNIGNPFMKFLSLIDPDEASADFAKLRGTQPRTNITYIGLDGTMIQPSFALSAQANQTLELVGKFFPALIGLIAFNALVLVLLVIAGVYYLCRRRRNRTARTPRGRTTPMPINPRNSYIAGVPLHEQPHTYQPVSMALTEDTFVPPSPAFHSMDKDTIRTGDRPKSVA
ncbi:hypothetical protein AX16_003170 [Volvariella volvacea WC 439]|nr:hypothetical protein AX16_003170 [Volvariella volvacea WC 439]